MAEHVTVEQQAQDQIKLVLPGAGRHVRLARLLAGGIAAAQSHSLALVEDARIAVDEVCTSLIEMGQGQPLVLTFVLQRDSLLIRGTTKEVSSAEVDDRRLAMSLHLLERLAQRHEFTRVDGQGVFTVTIPFTS